MNKFSSFLHWGALLSICGLVMACSTSPAPWSKGHGDSSQPEPPAVIVVEEPKSQPEPVARPEPEPEPVVRQPVFEPEPEPIPEPVAVEAPEPIQTSASSGDIMALPGNYFAVQIYASKTQSSMDKYVSKYDLHDLQVVSTRRGGGTILVLVSIQPDRKTANKVAADLKAQTGAKPWVRSLAGLQKIVAQ